MSSTLLYNIKSLTGILPKEKLYLRGDEIEHVASINNAWLLIEDGLIKDFGAMTSVPDYYGERIDASNRLVLPAFIDSHTHLVFAGTREDEFELRIKGKSYEEIAKAGGGILNSAKKLEMSSEDELFENALNRLKELVEMGTGAIEIKSGYGLSVDNEIKMLRVIKRLKEQTDVVIKSTFLALHAVPTKYVNDVDGFIDMMINEALPQIAKENLADYVDAFCEGGYFDVEQTVRLISAASKLGLKAKIHVNQFEVLGGIPRFVELGAISVDHLEVMNDADIEALNGSCTVATALPSCSLFISIPYAPIKKLIANNAIVALATDFNPGSSPSGNMQLVQSLACTKMGLTPNQAFNASTINGAKALELEHKLGSITKGKIANLLITKQIPSLGYLAYNFGHNHIEKVFLGGRLQG